MAGMTMTWRRSYAFLALATIALVAAADFFFYGHPVGWPAAIVAAAMLAMLAIRSTRFLGTLGGRVVALATLGLLGALIEQPTWLNVLYLVLCLSAIGITNTLGWRSDFALWLRRWGRWIGRGWAAIFLDNGLVVRWLVRRGISPRAARSIAVWVVPVLLSAVFVAIFAIANPIISDFFSRLGQWLSRLSETLLEGINVGRMLFWLAFAAFAWMLLRARVRRRRARQPGAGPRFGGYGTQDNLYPATGDPNRAATPLPAAIAPPVPSSHRAQPQAPRPITAGLVIRCLILFNIVFLVQNALDSRYLLHEGPLPHRIEYREYVRRGAYPLVAAALLAGAFVLITFRPGSETDKSPAARRLVYAWIAQTILLTVSAAWRLERYVEMSELTRLRVASIIWFFLVIMGLAYIIRRIVSGRSNRWLVNINAVTALIVLYPCCFVNFDGMIADFNAMHCREAGGRGSGLDIEYFRALGPTSVVALDRVREQITAEPRRRQAQDVSADLHAELEAKLQDWRGWTWRRQRTTEAAETMRLAQRQPDHLPLAAAPQVMR